MIQANFRSLVLTYQKALEANPGLGRIFQTRHGSEIMYLSVRNAEPDIGQTKKAPGCGTSRRFWVFFLLLVTSSHDSAWCNGTNNSRDRVEPAL